jgi:hypothetical protein
MTANADLTSEQARNPSATVPEHRRHHADPSSESSAAGVGSGPEWPGLLLAVIAAFGAYFCMYFFRKPWTAGAFQEPVLALGGFTLGFKTVLVIAQTIGYAISKFVGVRVIAELPPSRRVIGIVACCTLAELALVGFAVTPRPWNAFFLFLNGLPLGMVFGMVLGTLEGRRHTEALAAGLCASFILADGFTKSTGTWLVGQGISETSMPALAGLLAVVPMALFLVMLSQVPQPSAADVAARAPREPMTAADRRGLVGRHFIGLAAIVTFFLLVTVIRSVRADFQPELLRSLGYDPTVNAGIFAWTEFWVALGVLAASGLTVLIQDNRRAFFMALWICGAGFLILAASLLLLSARIIGPVPFVIMTGLGLYLPYVAVHTTVLERLLAMTRDKGNIGFLMYLADAFGYLGYVGVLLAKTFFPPSADGFAGFFIRISWFTVIASLGCLAVAAWFFRGSRPGSGGMSLEDSNRAS